MIKIECKDCGRGLTEGLTLYALKKNGVNVAWYCKKHYPLDLKTLVEVDIIKGKKNHHKRRRL